MSVSKDDVKRVARLCRLIVPENQEDAMATQLTGLLDWVDQLATVATDSVQPLTSVTEQTLHKRTDTVQDGNMASTLLSNTPHTTQNFFSVPKVVE
jgi:aspartyl-tRNA(Asn)/glutamyl-tRNA(Gln) amidotransferase subunit C